MAKRDVMRSSHLSEVRSAKNLSYPNGSGRFQPVVYRRGPDRWLARALNKRGKVILLGSFADFYEAVSVYADAVASGEFRRVPQMRGGK